MSERIRILLVDDHQVVREGLRALLDVEPDFDVVGEATDGFEAVRLTGELGPSLVVMDVGLPGATGVDATKRIAERYPGVRVVMLSMHDDGPTVERALRAGAEGYVLKGAGSGVLKEAIRVVAAGERYLSPEVAEYLLAVAEPNRRPGLTQREREILKLVAEGHTGKQIANLLAISPKTVENHRGHIMDKLGIRTTAGLVRYALKAGLTA